MGRERWPQEAQEAQEAQGAQGQACSTASPTRPDVALRGDAVQYPEPRGWQHTHVKQTPLRGVQHPPPGLLGARRQPLPRALWLPDRSGCTFRRHICRSPQPGATGGTPPTPRDTCMEGAPWAVPRRRTGSQELRVTPRFSFPCIRDDNHTHSGPGPLLPNSEVRSQGS